MLEAFGGRQRDLLTLLLNNKKGLTIDRMAAALNITRNAVREHVSALERDRLVAPAAFTVTGGRPGRVYALTDRGLALFPKHYDTDLSPREEWDEKAGEIAAIFGDFMKRVSPSVALRTVKE